MTYCAKRLARHLFWHFKLPPVIPCCCSHSLDLLEEALCAKGLTPNFGLHQPYHFLKRISFFDTAGENSNNSQIFTDLAELVLKNVCNISLFAKSWDILNFSLKWPTWVRWAGAFNHCPPKYSQHSTQCTLMKFLSPKWNKSEIAKMQSRNIY